MSEPEIIAGVRAEASFAATLRRDIHAHPELGFQEDRTSDMIANLLSSWGIKVHRGLARTGIVGVLEGGKGTGAIGLRADIDALPITERNTFDHASKYPGKMHACGHDGHAAMLLTAAKYLSRHRNFRGTVYFIFQPAEEGGGGAREMIRGGLFDQFPMDAIFGVHNWPGLKVGQFAICSGPMFGSSSSFKITIRGRGAHAAFPHEGVDSVLIACQMVQAFQTIITRNARPTDGCVLSVTMVHAGEANNVISDSCEIQGSVRAFTLEVLNLIEGRMHKIARATCEAFDATLEFDFHRNYPATVNHAQEAKAVRGVLQALVGEQNVLEFHPTTGAEDFSFYLLEKPGCYFVIGNGEGEHRMQGHGDGPCSLHNPCYDFNDELIPLGGAMWVRLVETWLAGREAVQSEVAI